MKSSLYDFETLYLNLDPLDIFLVFLNYILYDE